MMSIPVLILILVLSSFLIYKIQHFFLKHEITDKINSRSSHSSVATRSGGISIFIVLFIFCLYNYIYSYELFDYSLVVPLSILTIVGLYDDLYSVDSSLKFLFQIIAAKIILDTGLAIDQLHGFLGVYEINRISSQVLTIFIIVAIINSINFIDGIDGLLSVIFIKFIVLFEFFSANPSPLLNLSIILLILIFPLLYFNLRKKNKVFLGDAGSLLLGGIVSIYVLTALGSSYEIKPKYDLHKILFIISILFYPILDLILIFFKRIIRGDSPFKADKNHLHHIVLGKFNTHYFSTLFIFSVSLMITCIIHFIF